MFGFLRVHDDMLHAVLKDLDGRASIKSVTRAVICNGARSVVMADCRRNPPSEQGRLLCAATRRYPMRDSRDPAGGVGGFRTSMVIQSCRQGGGLRFANPPYELESNVTANLGSDYVKQAQFGVGICVLWIREE